MKLSEAKILAELLIEQHLNLDGIEPWGFDWNESKTAMGMCNYRRRVIILSTYYTPLLCEDDIEQILLHEIAHAMTRGDGHGKVWRACAKSLGVRNPRSRMKLSVDLDDMGYKYAMVIDGEEDNIIRGYHRKPSRNFIASLPMRSLKSRPDTKGKLKVIRLSA